MLVIVLAILLVIVVLIFGRLATTWHEHNRLKKEMIQVRENYNRFIISNKLIPDQNDINTYEEYAQKLEDLHSNIYRLMKNTLNIEIDKSGLEFKQHLLTIQQELQNQAREHDIIIPMDIAFKEFIGDKIPDEKQIPLLCLQLEIITFLIESCIESEVERIDTLIKIPPIQKSQYNKELPFKLTFKSEMNALVRFLDIMQSQKAIFLVDNLNITTVPQTEFRQKNNLGYILEASMDISYIELK
jgi:hypothetical protein